MPYAAHHLSALALFAEPACDQSSFSCTASQWLHWLSSIAIVLAVIFVLVVALAVRLWRKNKNSDDTQ